MSKTTTHNPETEPMTVELWIEVTVYEAAMNRAIRQGEALAGVARAALFAAAASAKPVENPKVSPRKYGEGRNRIRFRVPRDRKESAYRLIEASGVSVPVAVEDLLRLYVDTGTIIDPSKTDESQPADTEQ